MGVVGLSICYTVGGMIALGLMIYGFWCILKGRSNMESDLGVIQRQLRGFALLLVAQVALFIALGACTGVGVGLKKLTSFMA